MKKAANAIFLMSCIAPYRFLIKVRLTLPVPIPGRRKKLNEIFIFTLLCGASKGFNSKRFELLKKLQLIIYASHFRDVKLFRVQRPLKMLGILK